MPVQRWSEMLEPMVADSMDRMAMGDDLIWELIFGPNPQSGSITPILIIQMRGVILGTVPQIALVIQVSNPFIVNQDDVDEIVRQGLEGLRNARSQQAAGPPVGPTSSINGHGALR